MDWKQGEEIKAIEDWKWNHEPRTKARWVKITIEHDNSYGASCWEVKLESNNGSVECNEVAFFDYTHAKLPDNLVFAERIDGEDDDWPGLSKTILAALKKAKELGV